MPKKFILVISKNADNAERISEILNNDNYLAVCCEGCQYVRELCGEDYSFSLIIFNALNGYNEDEEIFSEDFHAPVMALCGKNDIFPDNILTLTDPFKGSRLISEVNRLCSADGAKKCGNRKFKFGNICFSSSTGSVTKSGKEIALSLREQELFSYLCNNADKPLSKEAILSDVWKKNTDSSTLNVHILKLRAKLEDNPKKPKHICTIYGKGYILRTK